jgi:esterase
MILHAVDAGGADGENIPLVLLHGLFGAATNFAAIQRRLAVTRRVIAFDLRNHGLSPHDPAMSYAAMATDVLDSLTSLGVERAAILGHSMGGKVAIQAALLVPDRISLLMVADIAPVRYDPAFRGIADAMLALSLTPGLTRAAADAALAPTVPDAAVRAFLLQNLRFGPMPAWRIGLQEIAANLPAIEDWDTPPGRQYAGPTLVLRGERSEYVRPEYRPAIQELFPNSKFTSLKGAGHWLHADAPDAFVAVVEAFLQASLAD